MSRIRRDIVMCSDSECPSRGSCRHHEAGGRTPDPYRQTYDRRKSRGTPISEGAPMNDVAASTPQIMDPTPPGTHNALEQDGDTDYRLVGSSCWISVGKHVVFIRKQGRGVAVEIYDETPGRFNELLGEAVATTSSLCTGTSRGPSGPRQ